MKVMDELEYQLSQAKNTLVLRPFEFFDPKTDVKNLKTKADFFEFEVKIPAGLKVSNAQLKAKVCAQVLGSDETCTLKVEADIFKATAWIDKKTMLAKEDFSLRNIGNRVMSFNLTNKIGYVESMHVNDISKIKFKIFLDSKTFVPCVSLMKSSLELVLTLE